MARLNMGEAKDDIHVCILCMRAIMNNKVQEYVCNNKRYKNYDANFFSFIPFLIIIFKVMKYFVLVEKFLLKI